MRNDSHINDFSSPNTLGKALAFALKFSFCNNSVSAETMPFWHTGLLLHSNELELTKRLDFANVKTLQTGASLQGFFAKKSGD
jgi:hypothetical protein